jgi:hypothetical protein
MDQHGEWNVRRSDVNLCVCVCEAWEVIDAAVLLWSCLVSVMCTFNRKFFFIRLKEDKVCDALKTKYAML